MTDHIFLKEVTPARIKEHGINHHKGIIFLKCIHGYPGCRQAEKTVVVIAYETIDEASQTILQP